MNVEVSKDKVVILQESSEPHENEYNITECHFTFDDFTDSFQVKRAIFTVLSTNEMYETDIINNKCNIPIEVLKHEYETVKLGVYGYNIEIVDEKETLKERFSPSYATFVVPTGSYEEGALSPEIITPSQYDIYSQALQEGLDDVAEALEEVSHVDIDASKSGRTATITITNRNNEEKSVDVSDGISIENMEIADNHLWVTYNEPTETQDLGQVVPIKGQDYFTTDEIEQIESETKEQVKTDLDFDNTVARIDSDIQDLNSNKASKTELEQEISARELADTSLQGQIDAITSSKDVVDIVGTYSDLQNYDTSTLTEDDVIKVLDDSTHNNAMSYYRWSNNTWTYIGSEGPFYTKAETDARLNTKQATIDNSHKLASDLVDDTNQTHKFTNENEKTTWNAKYDKPSNGIPKSDLVESVQESLNKADSAIQDVSDKEDKSNKVTEINSSSTDTQYPSAKCVYNSQEEQNEQIAELEMLYNAFPTVSDEDTEIQLDNTAKVKFREIDLKGNTSQVVIPEETGTTVSDTSIYVDDVNTDKESSIEMSGNTYQANAILPSEYTQVDYIQSSGTQYIDTGINADTKLRTILDISFINPTNANQTMGAINIGTPNKRYHLLSTSNAIAFWVNNTNYNIINTASTDRHLWDLNVPEGKVVIDKTTTTTIPTNIDDTELNFWLFGRNSNSTQYKAYFKLWTCKMYYNGTLVRDFIPCYRNSDNEVGLYDLVNNVFYINQGTGAFTYGSVASIPNPDYPQNIEVVTGTQNVNVCGKNLFDKDNINVLNAYIGGTSGTITNSNGDKTLYMPVKSNTTYTISKTLSNRFRIGFTDILPTTSQICSPYSLNQDSQTTYTITSGTSSKYLILYYYTTSDTLTEQQILNSIQIEQGSTATTYEAYQGTTYPVNLGNIELCKISTYKDRIYSLNNKWYLEKNVGKAIVDGSENVTMVNSETPNWYYQINITSKILAMNIPAGNFICYHYKNENISNNNTLQGFNINSSSTTSNMRVRYGTQDTVQNYKLWLSNNNSIVYAPLATPTTTEITDTTLVSQLNNLYNAQLHPITNINTDTNNLLPYIDLHYNFVTPSPSPSRPSNVNVVKGNNTITISNSDNIESQTYPINLPTGMELCKINTYQDYIYESNGNWYFRKNINKITLNGSEENWSSIVHSGDYYRLALAIEDAYDFGLTRNTNLYCDMFKPSTTNNYNIAFFSNKSAYFYLPQWMTTKNEFMSFLSTNNSLFYYVLATPTDTQITDATLISQLNAIKKAYSYDTQTNISQTNADKPFIIYAEAIRSLKDVFE